MFGVASEFAVRSGRPQGILESELRAAVKQTAPNMAEMNLQPMEQSIANSLSQRRLALRLVSGFGTVALVLAAVGLYGVLSYAVTQRRKEIEYGWRLGQARNMRCCWCCDMRCGC